MGIMGCFLLCAVSFPRPLMDHANLAIHEGVFKACFCHCHMASITKGEIASPSNDSVGEAGNKQRYFSKSNFNPITAQVM